ncbi:MAG TPA: S41 family peptidase [Mucilaginibacter sp.]|nr:S41 family peptidase [Mucilaginibacter sp.]
MKKILYLVIILLSGFFTACKKDKKINNGTGTDPDQPSKTGTTLQLAEDSVYLYAKENYLWYNQLPSYADFKPRSFTNSAPLTALSDELDALSQYAINPDGGKPYEYYQYDPGRAKYSFIDDGTETGALNGVKGDFGFDYNYNAVDDIRVVYVYPGSPAGLAGIRRGYRIISVNDNTNISYDGVSGGHTYGDGSGTNLNYVFNSIFNSGSIKMTLRKPDGSTITVNLSTANYNVNPVLKDTVFDVGGGKKIGYFVFNSFTSDANADPKLDAVFAKFTTAGVTDVVVDLRYNGGGYVSTAEYLDNLLVPSSKNNTLMYKTYFNDILSNNKETLLQNQVRRDVDGTLYNLSQIDYSLNSPYNTPKFSKIGSLNVDRVFFIITGGTASASELTINNLRPVMDVQLVGETSYGKPVGFFDIQINKYTMFTPEFSTKNSANQGDYFNGMTPNTTNYPGVNDFDDYTKEFGDPSEGLLAHIINKVKTGTYGATKKVVQSLNPGEQTFSLAESRDKAIKLNKDKFSGMIFNFKKVQLKK